jgi:hypothetical protein
VEILAKVQAVATEKIRHFKRCIYNVLHMPKSKVSPVTTRLDRLGDTRSLIVSSAPVSRYQPHQVRDRDRPEAQVVVLERSQGCCVDVPRTSKSPSNRKPTPSTR